MAYLCLNKKKRATTKAEKRAMALAECQQGRHTLTPTFRAGERMCAVCGVIFSCPTCMQVHRLPPVQGKRVFPFPCEEHRGAGVQP
ncbi:MAG TPA: hypothetical protein VH593_24375 [Ktedonobacteraceae bacterium]|jgi:hypothetical protein